MSITATSQSSSGKGKIQSVLKDVTIEGKRILAVIEANKRRAALLSQDRERLSALFKAEELRPPFKNADKKTHRYYNAALESWVDLQIAVARNAGTYTLSNIRTRCERYRERYESHIARCERVECDSKLKNWQERLHYDSLHPAEAAERDTALCRILDMYVTDPTLTLPDELMSLFKGIERGKDLHQLQTLFDNGNTFTKE